MSNASIHNNDLLIPDGVTFFDSIYASGFAQMKGDSSREIICKEFELGPIHPISSHQNQLH